MPPRAAYAAMDAEVLPVEAQATQRYPAWRAKVAATVMPGVFERAGRVQALMFGVKVWHSGDARGLRKFVERSVAFAQGDDFLLGLWRGQELPESPHAAQVDRFV